MLFASLRKYVDGFYPVKLTVANNEFNRLINTLFCILEPVCDRHASLKSHHQFDVTMSHTPTMFRAVFLALHELYMFNTSDYISTFHH